MSLINKMLNELEKRSTAEKKEKTASSPNLRFIAKNYQVDTMAKTISFLFIFASLLIAAGIYFYNPIKKEKDIFFEKLSAWTRQFTAVNPKVTSTQVNNSQIVITFSSLENITYNINGNKTTLDFIFTTPTTYFLTRSQDQKTLTITLNNTKLNKSYSLPPNMPLITSLSTLQQNNNTAINFSLADGTQVDNIQFYDQPTPHLEMIFSSNVAAPKMSKVEIPVSSDLQAQKLYNQVLELLNEQEHQTAIERLYLLLGDFPNFAQARELLGEILINEGKPQRAIEIMDMGLKKYPDYYPFVKLKAYAYASRGDTDSALRVLKEKQPADIAEDPDYFSLLAAMYNERGQYMQAAEIYYQLTNLQPTNTNWWIGLGTALESSDKNNAAKEAYQKALSLGQISPDLRDFLSSKLNPSR